MKMTIFFALASFATFLSVTGICNAQEVPAKTPAPTQSRIFEDVPLYDWGYKALAQLSALSDKRTLPHGAGYLIHPMTHWEFAMATIRWDMTRPQTDLTWQDAKARDIGEALKIEFAPDIEEVLSHYAQGHIPLSDLVGRPPLASLHMLHPHRRSTNEFMSLPPLERK